MEVGSLRRIERHATILITTTKQSWRSCSLRTNHRSKLCVIELLSEGMTSALCSFDYHAVFPHVSSPFITSFSYFPPILSSHSAHLLSSPFLSSLRILPFPKSRPLLPHTLRNAKTPNPLPRWNLGIRRPRRTKHSIQRSPPVPNDCSSRQHLLRRSDRPTSLLPTWSRYRVDE